MIILHPLPAQCSAGQLQLRFLSELTFQGAQAENKDASERLARMHPLSFCFLHRIMYTHFDLSVACWKDFELHLHENDHLHEQS